METNLPTTSHVSIEKLDDGQLTTFIKVHSDAINQLVSDACRDSLPHQINLGLALIEAKRRFGQHGKWIPWVRKNLPFDERMSQYYIRLADKANKLKTLPEANTKRVSRLSFRALRDLTEAADRPNEPRRKRPIKKDKRKPVVDPHLLAAKFVAIGYHLLEHFGPEGFEQQVAEDLRGLLTEAATRLERAHRVEGVGE